MVVWLTGLSGVGKSTVGGELWRQWRSADPNTVLIDGDVMRRIFGHDTGSDPYTLEGRRTNIERIAAICGWLDAQDINVVCCVLAVFDDVLESNRKRYSAYLEVRLTAPRETLIARDPKGLYAEALAGRTRNVVGVDIPYALQSQPDLAFDTAQGMDALHIAERIYQRIRPR